MNQLAEVQAVTLQFPPGGSHHFEKAPFFFFSFWLVLWLVLGIEPRTFYILNRCSPTELYA